MPSTCPPCREIKNHFSLGGGGVFRACLCGAQPYFVSPSGDDANPGTLEKPFATLQRAQQAARQKRGDVFLRGGTYYLPATLVFTAQDSGTKDAPVVFQNYQGEKPVISGGVRLENLDWQPYTNGIFQAEFRRICRPRKFSSTANGRFWRVTQI